MITVFKFALVGFAAGITMALLLMGIGLDRVVPTHELHVLWPTSSLGLDFSGWADGNAWDFLKLLLIFFGNGVLYAAVAAVFGAVVELARR